MPSAPFAVVEELDGSLLRIAGDTTDAIGAGRPLERGAVVRAADGARAQILLVDGSRVEMRSQSTLSLDRASDGVRLTLRTGSVIVHAAPQRWGHLSVQTKDVTISVLGTVFLVDADDGGSRVAVIEGAVHVQRGNPTKTLQPGQQVTTNAMLEAIPRSRRDRLEPTRRGAGASAAGGIADCADGGPGREDCAAVRSARRKPPIRSRVDKAV